MSLQLQNFDSLQAALLDSLKKYAHRVALIEVDRDREKEKITYRELHQRSKHFDFALQEQGFSRNDKLSIIMSNQSKWIITAVGLFLSNGTLIPLDYKLSPQDQLKLLAHSESKFLVIEYPLWKRMIGVDTDHVLKNVKVFVTDAPYTEKFAPNTFHWETSQSKPCTDIESTAGRDEVACIVYSSGTGGTPKGCMLTHGNYLAQAQCLADMYPIGENDTYFSFIPTNHAIDFMCGFLLPLLFGSKIVHQRTLRPEYFSGTIQKYKISHMALVPLLLQTLEQKIRDRLASLNGIKKSITHFLIRLNSILTKDRPRYGLSKILLAPIHSVFGGHLRLIFAGGAFVESSTAQFFYDLGIPVVIGYGLTEAGTVLTVNDLHPFRANTVGKPLSITKIRIYNPDDQGIGEVWASGPTVMKGYWKSQEMTDEVFEDGWLKTGDQGKFDNGHLVLLGRKKNMIVTQGGKNVYPEDIETTFDRMGDVEEYCIVAKRLIWPSSNLAQDSMVLILRPKDPQNVTTIVNEVRERNRKLSDYKRVSEVLVWNHPFDRTASMKIKRIPLANEIAKSIQVEKNPMVQL